MIKEEKNNNEIELRSDEVQEVMNKISPWIIRSGITALFFIVIILFIGCYLFKYPDVLQADITVTTENPPTYVLARVSGRLDTLYVGNHQKVSKGTFLGCIINPAVTNDVLWLMQNLQDWQRRGYSLNEGKIIFETATLQLGDIQAIYSSFVSVLLKYTHFKELNYYDKKICTEKERLADQKKYYGLIRRQHNLAEKEMKVANRIYTRDSILYVDNVLIPAEFDVSKSQYLQQLRAIETSRINLLQAEMQVRQSEENVLDVMKQWMDEEQQYQTELKNTLEQLLAKLQAWKQDYLLESPIDGIITFITVWTQKQNVQSGESLFVIVPTDMSAPKGKAFLPIQSSGKVKIGQKAHIRLSNYPEKEFGYVQGEIFAVSPVPTAEGNFIVEVSLPNGLETNYGKELPPDQELKGMADIILEDLSVLERLLAPIRQIWMHNIKGDK